MGTHSLTCPVLYVPRLLRRPQGDEPGLSIGSLQRLLDLLDDAEVTPPAVTGWMAGHLSIASLGTPFVIATSEVRPRPLGTWARLLANRGWSSLLFCTSETFTGDGPLAPSALPILTGHGVAIASRGCRGEPLVGQEVGHLRRELTESREQFTRLAGYPVRVLAPVSTPTGRAIDGLVAREARRAGYEIALRPGRRARQTFERDDTLRGLEYLTCYASDDPEELARWVTGSTTDRAWTQLRRLADAPRRLWSRVTEGRKQ